MIKFQNNKQNRKLLKEAGYVCYDPHCTFNRKAWIVIGDDGKTLYGVDHRNYVIVSVEDFLNSLTPKTFDEWVEIR